MKCQLVNHEFVKFIPEELKDGVVYISVEFATSSHLCFCGCKKKVVTPLSPAQWSLTFDGKTISLSPSIGSWDLDCQSHYWISKSLVNWAPRMSKEKIERGKFQDRRAIEKLLKDLRDID